MKNKIKRLVFIIGLFLICLTNVNAKEMSLEEIPNNSYVIGTHVFTEKTTLLTKHIMLSSKTITSNSLDDMIIYYKTPRGKWINGAEGTQVETPTKFDIDYIDLELVETEFNISYILNGGTASNPLIYTALTDDFTLVNPVKEGYLFTGWTGSNGDAPELEATITKGTTGDLIFIANWLLYGDVNKDKSVDSVDLIFIEQYIEGMIDFTATQKSVSDVNTDGVIDDVDVHILSKYISDGGTKPEGYNIKLPYDSGEKYTITYNLNGGNLEERPCEKYAEISLPYKLETPTKEGYVFIGWTGSNGDTPQQNITINKGTTGNLEYIANWILLGDVDNDGNINPGDVTYVRRHLAGLDIPENIYIEVADVNFDGEVDDVDVDILKNYGVGNIKILPYDSGEKYTITYNLNGGNLEERPCEKYAEISLPYKLETPTKEGYVFLGWTEKNENVPKLSIKIEEGTTGDLEYTAHWIVEGDIPVAPIIEKTATAYEVDGRLGIAINFAETELDDSIVGAEIYTKTNEEYTKVKNINIDEPFEDILNPGENKVYVARYYIMYNNVLKVYSNYSNELLIKNENIITYDLDGGINPHQNPMGYARNNTYDSLLEEPTKLGYTFIGWTGSNGDTPQLKVSIQEGTTGHLHYIANWELSDESAIDKTIPLAPIIEEEYTSFTKYGRKDVVINICENGAYDYNNKPFGAALYRKTKDKNNLYSYTLVEEINNECELLASVNPGETNIYAAMTYILDENENRIYSPYSNELLIENPNIITYDLNGGANANANPMGYSSDYPFYSQLEVPTKYGYTFKGWTGSNGDTPELEVDFNRMEGHLHYIANWELNK